MAVGKIVLGGIVQLGRDIKPVVKIACRGHKGMRKHMPEESCEWHARQIGVSELKCSRFHVFMTSLYCASHEWRHVWRNADIFATGLLFILIPSETHIREGRHPGGGQMDDSDRQASRSKPMSCMR